MCRKSPANKYRRCYLRRPRLSTIPEEADDGHSLRISLPRHLLPGPPTPLDSPKGLRRLLLTSFTGNRSPRLSTKHGKETTSSGQRPQGVTSDMGSGSPLCRRAAKNNDKENVLKGRKDRLVNKECMTLNSDKKLLELEAKVLTSSPRTRLRDHNNNMGHHSPQCRRVSRTNSCTTPDSRPSPVSAGRAELSSLGDMGGRSPASRRTTERNNVRNNRKNTRNRDKNKADDASKDKSLFKKMVKFLTEPQVDYLNA